MGLFNRRSRKLEKIYRMAEKNDVDGLIQLLNDDDMLFRSQAASMLGLLGDWKAFKPLNEALDKYKDASTTVQCTAAPSFLQHPEARKKALDSFLSMRKH